MAARATFALRSGEWFRRARCQAEIPLIAPSEIVEPPLPKGNSMRMVDLHTFMELRIGLLRIGLDLISVRA